MNWTMIVDSKLLTKVCELRRGAGARLMARIERARDSEMASVGRVVLLASSSRGGSSVTSEMLQWQGARCHNNEGRLLTLPGEEKPHLVLAGLAFPGRPERFDDLFASDIGQIQAVSLFEEMRSEVGHPIDRCDDLRVYAIQLYRRLLLQWPEEMTALDMDTAIGHLEGALLECFPHGYADAPEARRLVLAACLKCFAFIRPSFYDCTLERHPEDLELLNNGSWSIEETPFVLPPPWHNATDAELAAGCLLLRDPSNAWRFPFWRALFPQQSFQVLHLVRDPRESIQGLCDGWNYPFGFQTMPVEDGMSVKGYTDIRNGGSPEWKRHRLNFSISAELSRRLTQGSPEPSLVEICAQQWREAHESILAEVDRLNLPRTVVRFSDLRKAPVESFTEICRSLRIELSESGLKYARSFPDRWVMATAHGQGDRHERWKDSPFSSEIRQLVASGYFDSVCEKLGLSDAASLGRDGSARTFTPTQVLGDRSSATVKSQTTSRTLSCLSPFFIGRVELGLERRTGPFDEVLPAALVGNEPGSQNAINKINGAIRDFVSRTLAMGERPLVLSGDCLSVIGCLAGLRKSGMRSNLLWFDAHGDFHTHETTLSGHLGGMPLAMISGRGDQSLLHAVGLDALPDNRISLVGARDLESGEREALFRSGIRRAARVTELLDALTSDEQFWVHFDTDYINPADAPAMRYPAPGGASAMETKTDFSLLADRVNIVGVSVSAWAPHLDVNGQTAATCWDTISPLMTTTSRSGIRKVA